VEKVEKVRVLAAFLNSGGNEKSATYLVSFCALFVDVLHNSQEDVEKDHFAKQGEEEDDNGKNISHALAIFLIAAFDIHGLASEEQHFIA